MLVQICVQEYNLQVQNIIRKRQAKYIRKSAANQALFLLQAALLDSIKVGIEILCFSRLNQYLGKDRVSVEIFKIAYTKRKSRSSYFLSQHLGLQADRVALLFRLSAKQPTQGCTTLYSLKVNKILVIIQKQVGCLEYAS